MIKTISDYPLVVGEIARRSNARKSSRGLTKYWLRFHPYCEALDSTGAPTCMNQSTHIIYSKRWGSDDEPQPSRAVCDEHFNRKIER